MKIVKLMCLTIIFIMSIIITYGEAKSQKANTKNLQTNKVNISTNQTTKSNKIKEKKKAKIKVTFIELGSVKCIPCRMMQPIIAEIEKEYADQVKVVFYDVWTPDGGHYARQYQIRVIPTQVFLDSNGKEYYRHEGFFPKEELVKILKMKGVK